jgi:hypothetical protein
MTQPTETRLRELREYSASVRARVIAEGNILENYDPILDEMGSWDLQTKSQRILESLETALRAMHISDIYVMRNELQVRVAPKGPIQITFPRRPPLRQRLSRPKLPVILTIGEGKAEKWSNERMSAELKRNFRRIVRYLLARQRERNENGLY